MNVLEVRGLCKQYPAFRLDNVSFDLSAGAVMGFIGRNGAGKSTTLKAMLGLVHSEAGSVRIFGEDFTQNERAVKQRLGIVLGGIDFYPQKRVKTVAAAFMRAGMKRSTAIISACSISTRTRRYRSCPPA